MFLGKFHVYRVSDSLSVNIRNNLEEFAVYTLITACYEWLIKITLAGVIRPTSRKEQFNEEYE